MSIILSVVRATRLEYTILPILVGKFCRRPTRASNMLYFISNHLSHHSSQNTFLKRSACNFSLCFLGFQYIAFSASSFHII
ncbi:MAG: hypothetical protein LBC61_03560 [Candidatus Peribacteria bacterium]|nr:hypothetical protein [Candidatus Peribacteria bacterium]